MSNKLRRNVLKSVAVGSAVVSGQALQGKWMKPVVESVVLPAHAQTSVISSPTSFAGAVSVVQIPDNNSNPLIDLFIEEANAGEEDMGFILDLACIKVDGPGSVSVNATGLFSIYNAFGVQVGGDPVDMQIEPCIQVQNASTDTASDGAPMRLLGKLGLIRDASAGVIVRGGVSVRVDNVGKTADGEFFINALETSIPFSLPPSPCKNATCDIFEDE